jgi:hypothetical protein
MPAALYDGSTYGVTITTRDSSGNATKFNFIACIQLDRKLLNSQAYSCW